MVCAEGVDTLISDVGVPNTVARRPGCPAARLPAWSTRAVAAPAFLLLPLRLEGTPFALIRADQAQAAGIVLGDKEWPCCAPCATRR